MDILKVVTDYYKRKSGRRNKSLELNFPDTAGISDDVYRDLINMKLVDSSIIKNLNDFKLLQSGWVFDINFIPALFIIKERGYLEMLQDTLPQTEQTEKIFSVIYSYIDEKINIKEKEDF